MKNLLIPVALVAMILAVLAVIYQRDEEPLAVGVISWTASGAVVGSSELNAAEMFIEEHAQSPMRIVAVDDQWNPETSKPVTQQAIKEGVRFFVTSHPSKCAVAIMDLFSEPQALAIVTASTTPALTGLDDFTLRIIADGRQEQQAIAGYVETLPGRRILVIQDEGNLPYTEPAFEAFSAPLQAGGRWEIIQHKFTVSHFDPEALRPLFQDDYDALFILAGSYQLPIAGIAQLFHHYHPAAPIILTPWARSPAILDITGPALAKIILPSQYPSRHDDPGIEDYFSRFEARFGYAPHSMTIGVRQGLELLDQAFAQGHRTPESVKAYLLSQPEHQTSLGPIAFDPYGDVSQNFHFLTDLEKALR